MLTPSTFSSPTLRTLSEASRSWSCPRGSTWLDWDSMLSSPFVAPAELSGTFIQPPPPWPPNNPPRNPVFRYIVSPTMRCSMPPGIAWPATRSSSKTICIASSGLVWYAPEPFAPIARPPVPLRSKVYDADSTDAAVLRHPLDRGQRRGRLLGHGGLLTATPAARRA